MTDRLPHSRAQLRGRAGKAKSYAERLFDYPEIGPLPVDAARQALVKPAHDLDVEFAPGAVEQIITQTRGYPYFLQEWGKRAWEIAVASPITEEDVKSASQQAVAALDESFFRVRFDRLTPMEKRYLRAPLKRIEYERGRRARHLFFYRGRAVHSGISQALVRPHLRFDRQVHVRYSSHGGAIHAV